MVAELGPSRQSSGQLRSLGRLAHYCKRGLRFFALEYYEEIVISAHAAFALIWFSVWSTYSRFSPSFGVWAVVLSIAANTICAALKTPRIVRYTLPPAICLMFYVGVLAVKAPRDAAATLPAWSTALEMEQRGLSSEIAANLDPMATSEIPRVAEVFETVPGFDGVSVVIPAKFEDAYIVPTVQFLFDFSAPALLREIIVVDDQSEVAIEPLINDAFRGNLSYLSPSELRKVRVLRLPERAGLIRAKIIGANAALGSHILFLDGHCRVVPGYLERLLVAIGSNYRRIVVPRVTNVKYPEWTHVDWTGGTKMMFRWNFEFDWFEDSSDEVPVSSGGILLMSKRWWTEGGEYDPGMLEWGAENIEQSLRAWMCGGEVIVVRDAKIGHIFERPLGPNKVTGNTVQRNHARAAYLWVDEYLDYFKEHHPVAAQELPVMGGGLGQRLALRQALGCRPFNAYMDRFKDVVDAQGLRLSRHFNLLHTASSLCVAVTRNDTSSAKYNIAKAFVSLKLCNPDDPDQRFVWVMEGRRLFSLTYQRCLDRGNTRQPTGRPIVYQCDPSPDNLNQAFQMVGDRVLLAAPSQLRGNKEESPASTCLSGPDGARHMAPLHFAPCQPRVTPAYSDVFAYETIFRMSRDHYD